MPGVFLGGGNAVSARFTDFSKETVEVTLALGGTVQMPSADYASDKLVLKLPDVAEPAEL